MIWRAGDYKIMDTHRRGGPRKPKMKFGFIIKMAFSTLISPMAKLVQGFLLSKNPPERYDTIKTKDLSCGLRFLP